MGPIGAARVGYIDGEYVLNPPIDDMPNSKLDLVVAGTHDAVMMVESEAQELCEDVMLGAVMFGHQRDAARHRRHHPAGGKGRQGAARRCRKMCMRRCAPSSKAAAGAELAKAFQIADQVRAPRRAQRRQEEVRRRHLSAKAKARCRPMSIRGLLHDVEADVMRNAVLDTKKRVDGRDLTTVRPIVAEVGILPRTHGSALFTRGETQALVVATLGTAEDEQFVDSLEGTGKQTFMLHYNFPPYSRGRDRPHGFAGPPRNRPWQARLARHSSDAADEGKLPLHHPRGVGDHRIQRFVLDGDGLRHLAGADGCGRSASPSRSRASPWA